MDTKLAINFLIALLAIANPIGKIPFWLRAAQGQSQDVRLRLSFLILLTAGLVLLGALWGGRATLEFFNIDLASFRIGGGIVILLLAIDMLNGQAAKLENTEDRGDSPMQLAKSRFRRVVVPMAIPIIAGPGSISTTVVYSSKVTSLIDYLVLTGILLAILLTTFVTMYYARQLERLVGLIGMEIVTRLFGLILCGIAVQLIVEGLGSAFPKWLDTSSQIVDDISNGNAQQTSSP